MTIEERKISRPDSRWKAELLNLYRTSESQWRESLDAGDRDYQSGIMMACAAIWHRVTGEQLVPMSSGRNMLCSICIDIQPRSWHDVRTAGDKTTLD